MRKFFATEPIEKAISILFLIAVALMLTCSVVHAQTVKQETTTASRDSITGRTFTDAKGLKYEVIQGKRGGLYYWKTSAKGTRYKVYLKKGGDDK